MTAMACLLGDLVASRASVDRQAVHARLVTAVEEVNERFSPVAPLRIQAGDEFQGRFATRGEALAASLRVRLALAPEIDCRFGLGWGEVRVLDEATGIEDGPGWWEARAAIEAVAMAAGRAATSLLRTGYRGPDHDLVSAALLGRDQLVGALDARSLGLLRRLLDGVSQRELAETEGVSPSAISQRVRHHGLAVLVAQDELLGGVR